MIKDLSLKNMRLFWATLTFFMTLGLLLGCGTIKEKKLERDGLTLIYRPKFQAGATIEKAHLNHPIKISEEELKNHLYSLQYEELFLLGKKKYVISLKDVSEIATILTKAVNRMAPENILIFELETPRGTTQGEIFATENKINFRFNSIKGTKFSSNTLARSSGSTWRLVPVKGQVNKVTKRLLGSSTQGNWIVAKMALPQKSRRPLKGKRTQSKKPQVSPEPSSSPQRIPSTPSVNTDQELEKKLQFLKDLRDKDLIDDTEYEKKRRELLDSFL